MLLRVRALFLWLECAFLKGPFKHNECSSLVSPPWLLLWSKWLRPLSQGVLALSCHFASLYPYECSKLPQPINGSRQGQRQFFCLLPAVIIREKTGVHTGKEKLAAGGSPSLWQHFTKLASLSKAQQKNCSVVDLYVRTCHFLRISLKCLPNLW